MWIMILFKEKERNLAKYVKASGLITAEIHIKENFFLEMERKTYYIAYLK